MRLWLVISVVVGSSLWATPGRVVLVRHAEKADGGGPDPGLSEAGQSRAQILAEHAEGWGITQVFTTEYQRTIQTGAPTAAQRGLEVTVVAARDLTGLVENIKSLPSSASVLVVGHSNTVPAIALALGVAKDAEAVSPMAETEYDRIIVLTPALEGGWTTTVSRSEPTS